jgi:hypothetical protein
MTLQLVPKDGEMTPTPTKPEGSTYKITFLDEEGNKQEKEIKGYPLLFGPFLSINDERNGYMVPLFCVSSDDVVTMELID